MTKQEFLEFSLSKDLNLWQSCKYWAVPVPDRVVTLTGIGDTDGKLPMQYNNEIAPTTIFYRLDGSTTGTDYITNVKPICRPLSDLTKEIEHKGERFVPMIRLMQMAFCMQIDINRIELSIVDDIYFIKINDTEFGFDASDNSFLITLYNLPSFVPRQLELFQKLIEWHFDIADLISKGEAIDVNTLETNPYK